MKDNDGLDAPTPVDVPPQDASADRLRVGQAATSRILSKWRRLDQSDPKSRQYSIILKSLLEKEVDRKATTSLGGEDASVVLDILAKVRTES